MSNINRRAEELKDGLVKAMESLIEEEKIKSSAQVQELEQRLQITLEREQISDKRLNQYQEEIDKHRQLTNYLQTKLEEKTKQLDIERALVAELQSVLQMAFGSVDYVTAKRSVTDTTKLHEDLKNQIKVLNMELKTREELLLGCIEVLGRFASNVDTIPIVVDIKKKLAL